MKKGGLRGDKIMQAGR